MKQMKFYKYQGAGNDFLIADNRDGSVQLTAAQIAALCDRRYGIGADGLMLLESSNEYDFRMVYYNSDGSGGMMCGNGGRCIVAFAADRGLGHFDFDAADGFHTAQILTADGKAKTVRLKMKDVQECVHYERLTGPGAASCGYFLDTGTRHYVRFVASVDTYDVVGEGRDIRYNAAELQPVGANVNYVEPFDEGVKVRTYEKGVEDETFACGTGIVASCVASCIKGICPSEKFADGRVRYDVKAKRDMLSVDFILTENMTAQDVWLTGPATYVAEIIVDID
ncbi:MAG: diaminopimelate epimerase [Bacteroidales bacterium]|nr:diaminopimelate epimerase [Bacteroidales bacterium]